LIGVTLYMASLGHDFPFGWWLVMGAMVIAILALRRALQWRYPYRKQKGWRTLEQLKVYVST